MTKCFAGLFLWTTRRGRAVRVVVWILLVPVILAGALLRALKTLLFGIAGAFVDAACVFVDDFFGMGKSFFTRFWNGDFPRPLVAMWMRHARRNR